MIPIKQPILRFTRPMLQFSEKLTKRKLFTDRPSTDRYRARLWNQWEERLSETRWIYGRKTNLRKKKKSPEFNLIFWGEIWVSPDLIGFLQKGNFLSLVIWQWQPQLPQSQTPTNQNHFEWIMPSFTPPPPPSFNHSIIVGLMSLVE